METYKLTGAGSPIIIGSHILNQDSFALEIKAQQVCIITNETIAPLYLKPLQEKLSHLQCDVLILPDGEEHKNFTMLERIFDFLITHHHQRSTTIVGLGGGVILDIAGFAAACYQRGVRFISLPTTLLSQADAAIGGKTAINFHQTKNMIGAFYHPHCILMNPSYLLSLPEREYCAGLAEMIKHGLIADEQFFNWLDQHLEKILARDLPTLEEALVYNAEIKCKVVRQDEREAGLRMILNFGHTIGHALETESQYGLLHGEAVALGMLLELPFSNQEGLPVSVNEKVQSLLERAHLPIRKPISLLKASLKPWIMHDKKAESATINMPLLSKIGHAYIKAMPTEAFDSI